MCSLTTSVFKNCFSLVFSEELVVVLFMDFYCLQNKLTKVLFADPSISCGPRCCSLTQVSPIDQLESPLSFSKVLVFVEDLSIDDVTSTRQCVMAARVDDVCCHVTQLPDYQ